MKKILFVINTMGQAGAETALLELLRKLEGCGCEIFLYVLMGQGEMIEQIPSYVRLLNTEFCSLSVLTKDGRCRMVKTVLKAFFKNGGYCKKLWYLAGILAVMIRERRIRISKLLWRIVSEGAVRFAIDFDAAVAWLEGGSAYYVAEHVKARKKSAFIHIDYENAGYTRAMDQDCWKQFHRIFAVSQEVKAHFQEFYPEYACKTTVFNNMLDVEGIRLKAGETGGFLDGYDGIRLLSVGRLSYQKGYDIAIEAMKLLKKSGYQVRWYVLGEGDQRRKLEKKIRALKLKEDFILLGAVSNPYPYFAQTDIYVHTARYEGKSIAVQEAQMLGCAIVASDCNGNREEIRDGRDGILCRPDPQAIADGIAGLIESKERRMELGKTAGKKHLPKEKRAEEILKLLA